MQAADGTRKRRAKTLWQSIKDFYQLYTSGLSRSEIEHLLKQESLDVLDFYKRRSTGDGAQKQRDGFPVKQIKFCWEIFLSFVMKLTPARRLFYGIAVVLFAFAMFTMNRLYGVLAFFLLNLLLAFEVANRLLAKDELEIARDIQTGLQPVEPPKLPGLELASFYRPAKEVGGDYYDFFHIDEHRIGIIIGDVSGNGMPAALYAVKLQGILESLTRDTTSPKELLIAINEIISMRLKKQYFITAAVGVIDCRLRKLTLARAGHTPPLLIRAKGHESTWLVPRGIGIGLNVDSHFSENLEETEVELSDGDVVVFYTDGLTEAMDRDRREFGQSRLGKIVTESAGQTPGEITAAVIEKLTSFVATPLFADDVTLLVVKCVNSISGHQ